MNVHHAAVGPSCPMCSDKSIGGHLLLSQWFFECKKENQDLHASCFFRDKAGQELAYLDGRSRVHWPDSKHNVMLVGDVPCARAFDCFQIRKDGVAYFGRDYYFRIAKWFKDHDAPIIWGGDDPRLRIIGDFPHFQLKEDVF